MNKALFNIFRRGEKTSDAWKFGSNARGLQLCSGLYHMAKERGWSHGQVFSAKYVIRPPSRTIPDGVRALLDRPDLFLVRRRRDWDLLKYSRLIAGECYPCSESFWVDVPNCWVHVPSGTVITSEREVLYETTLSVESLYSGHSNQDFDDAETIAGDVLLLATAYGRNYAHWLFDSLPKLATECVDGRKLLLGDPVLSFQRQSLNLLGFGDDQILSVKGQLVRCRNLRVSVAAFTSGVPHPDSIQCIRKRFLIHPSPHANAPRRIYLSRQSTRRRLVNQSDLNYLLEELKFEHVIAEDLDVRQQLQIFSEAEIVLAPHGAGTANVIFMPSGSHLVELYNPQVWDHAAHRLSAICAVNHWHLFGQNVGKAFDIRIDCLLVRKLLETVLSPMQGPTSCMVESDF